MGQTAAVCRMVVAVGAAARSNGTDVAPAVITRVWGETMVNATVFPDAAGVQAVTSVRLFADETEARGSLQNESMTALYWPTRT